MCGIFGIASAECINNESANDMFYQIKHRGPERSKTVQFPYDGVNYFIGFHRLSITGTDTHCNQPFDDNVYIVVCNGEIYNYKHLVNEHDLKLSTTSDCEVILHLYKKYGIRKTVDLLDGEFAFAIFDLVKNVVHLVRDSYGVRPLFSNIYHMKKELIFASEAKCHPSLRQCVPGYIYSVNLKHFTATSYQYHKYALTMSSPLHYTMIYKLLVDSVHKRLHANQNIGFFLSGGLDSSLVLGIALHLINKKNDYKFAYPVQVFSIGTHDSTDIKASIRVVEFLKKKYGKHVIKHHIVKYTLDEGIAVIPNVIKCLESYDQTTVRASTPMYLLSRYVSQKTNVKVLLSGEGSDELFGGYLYFLYAPYPLAFDLECKKLLSELYLYDNLRADRTVSYFGLELRVPFLDKDLTTYVLSISPEYRMPQKNQMEKYVLRKSFEHEDIIPYDILFAQKQAFSDGVGYSWKNYIKEYANKHYSHVECKYDTNSPKTSEEVMYRTIFEKYYADRGFLTPKMWLPNKDWIDTKGESSATALSVHNITKSKL